MLNVRRMLESHDIVGEDNDSFCKSSVDLALATGDIFNLIKSCLLRELKKPIQNQLPLMEDGVTTAIKIIKIYYGELGFARATM